MLYHFQEEWIPKQSELKLLPEFLLKTNFEAFKII
jgi:hypothetical protein